MIRALLMLSSLPLWCAAAPPAPPPDGDRPAPTRVEWKRAGPSGPIEVIGTPTADAKLAGALLQRVADRLDALRTIEPHVVWHKIAWYDGTVEVVALADSSLYGSLTLLVLRDLLPGRRTAGSGIQQLPRQQSRFGWRVRALLARPQAQPIRVPLRPRPRPAKGRDAPR